MSGSSASEMSSLTDKNRCEGGADKSSVSAKRAGCMDSREPDYEYDPSFRNPHPRLWKTYSDTAREISFDVHRGLRQVQLDCLDCGSEISREPENGFQEH